MIKAGDRIGFKRTMYGACEFGVYVGTEESAARTTKWGNTLHVVRLENGEEAKFNYDGVNGSDAKCNMKHHIGWLTTTEDFEHCDRGYECAAWYENIEVKKGARFPLFAEVDKYYSDKENKYLEGGVGRVWTVLSGTITRDEFGSRFCGVPMGNYDSSKNEGKASTHHVSWYGYSFGGLVLAAQGDARYISENCDFPYEVELFGNLEIVPKSIAIDPKQQAFYGKAEIWSTSVRLARFENLVDALEQHLLENKLRSDVSYCDGEISIEVTWGDWKHEHGRLDYLVREFFSKRGISIQSRTEVTDEDGSDCYSAVHTYTEYLGLE